MGRREPVPVADQEIEDAARREDEARSDAEYEVALVASGSFLAVARHGDLPALTWDDDEIVERDAQLDAEEHQQREINDESPDGARR